MFSNIFKNKKVLVTGHTGFKGEGHFILSDLGANVAGISDKEISTPSNFSAIKLKKIMEDIRIDIRELEN